MSGIKIYSVFHKPFYQPVADFVNPIQVGKSIAANKMEMAGDDTGENISYLNPFFCEMTAVYWIIKNVDRSAGAWGLCHYRRYFSEQSFNILFKKKSIYNFYPSQKKINKVVNENLHKKIEALLMTHDAIVQQPKNIHKKKGVIKNLEENYLDYHNSNQWQILKEVLFEKYPDYKQSWEPFTQLKKMSFFNMMIAKWEVWDAYSSWVFDIMFEVYKRIAVSDQSDQQRVLGFMTERFLNLFLMHNKIKTAYLPVTVFDKS